jgi:CRP/FNR family transcriptional regulator, cyclic AMP receptor protein
MRMLGLAANQADEMKLRLSLAALVLFTDVDNATIAALEQQSIWHDLADGEILIPSGRACDRVYFVLRGELRASLDTPLGRVISLPLGHEGGLAEGSALAGPTSLPYAVKAVRPSMVVSIDAASLLSCAAGSPLLMQRLFAALAEARECYIRQIVELSTLSVRTRIHSELMRLCRGRQSADGSASILWPPTHADLANRVSTQREAVSRELSTLQALGIVMRRDGALFVPSVARLAALLDPDEI